ncbi:MAG: hypothetical protein A3H95_17125 [Acidobacteria bacterium RIFCSPLOWO2_02_FULL_64_15]|nr:MAG: hypothetical protein A3H95_17125 [Acidobacteria bacterium RIFCSPLOWO2_02_FULL_64_15]
MCRRLRCKLLVILLALPAATACSDSGAPSTTSSVTSPTSGVNVVENFTGTLTLNGGWSFPFSTVTSGSIAAELKSLDTVPPTVPPDPTLKVGLWVGVWDGARCSSGIADDNAVKGTVINAFAISQGNFCVRIYDSKGNVPAGGETFQIEVTHP